MESIIQSYCKSPVGDIRVSGTENFVTEIVFCKKDCVHRKETVHLPSVILDCQKQISQYFKGEIQNFTISFQLNGTDFQKLVWQELLKIPYGETVSYKDLSKKLNNVMAIRAVANANAKNKLAIVIPCHRVIGSNNSLTGYAGGVEKKKYLLELEKKHKYGQQFLFNHIKAF